MKCEPRALHFAFPPRSGDVLSIPVVVTDEIAEFLAAHNGDVWAVVTLEQVR